METYPLIADHGLIGDLHTAALVSTDGEIDWFCSPRFDSPSVFASLLDPERGGRFRLAPAEPGYVSKQLYFPGSAVLITRFMTAGGVGEVCDFMPVPDGGGRADNHRLVRIARVVRGQMRYVFECAPGFDYGRADHVLDFSDGGAVFRAGDRQLTMHVSGTFTLDPAGVRVRGPHGDAIQASGTVQAGQIGAVMLETAADGPPQRLEPAEVQSMLEDTVAFWRRWLDRSSYRGRWREHVDRSAMTLKLLTYAPSGAPVAAPTAGLPEQIGGERNWDYRYTWIRDGSLSVSALLGLGYVDEARAFVKWLQDRVQERAGEGSGPLKIMYRVDGSSDLPEEVLGHFKGYRGSAPVRIGNGAGDQLQLDIYGEAMSAIYAADRNDSIEIDYDGWTHLARTLGWLCEHWDQAEEGIWETRGGRQDFVYGRINSWTALDRAVRMAADHGLPGDLARWTTERDRIYRQVMDRGWNEQRRAFVQHYDTQVLDAALLRMVQVGFVTPRDRRWVSTLDAMDTELVSDSLVYRYNPEASPDGLRGSEGTFSLCTFWYVDALARAGRLDQAVLIFEKMLSYANHLGLYSEEIGLTGEQLGNFPQAFTHLSLINAALTLNERLDRRADG